MDDSLLFPIPDRKSRAQLLVQVCISVRCDEPRTTPMVKLVKAPRTSPCIFSQTPVYRQRHSAEHRRVTPRRAAPRFAIVILTSFSPPVCVLPVDSTLNDSQYFNKYCAPGEGNVSTSKRRGLANMLSGWMKGGSAEGLVIGAGVDDRLIRGLSEEVEGFSGREVGASGFVLMI